MEERVRAVSDMATVQNEALKAARLTSEQVWRKVEASSFAVLGYVTPRGGPRASGVVYKTLGRRLYVAVAPDSWKARHIAVSGKVSVTVPVRRGGILSLVAPIPPATVSFHATARVYPAAQRRFVPSSMSWEPCFRPNGGPPHPSSRSSLRERSCRTGSVSHC